MRRVQAMKLERSPLVLVLSQVRFSPVALMEEFVPPIQEELRRDGFVWFDEQQVQEISLGPTPVFKSGKRWVFGTRNRDESVILTDRFVIYETCRYDVFETFIARFRIALKIIKKVAEIALSDRIGLRYVDLIREIDGRPPRELFKESARGLTEHQLGTLECRHQSIAKAVTPHGNINVQIIENSGSNVLPPDLTDTQLVIDIAPNSGEVFRILDVDHFSPTTRDFDPDELVKAMWDLHEYSEKAFRAAVTDEAIEIWKRGAPQ